QHALAASILHLKNEPFVSKTLQNLFIEAFENSSFKDTTLIIPVPLSQKRFLERGFNQASVLAGILLRHAQINVDEQSLTRRIHTPMHRAAMDRKARELTVKNAFEVKRPNAVENQNILLID